jgi:DNA-binding transcriptional ArsR family regulator
MPKRRQLVRTIGPEVLQRAAEIIKMLGHPERLKIVEVLESGEATVSDIQEQLDLPQAIVSQHLAKMRGNNIVAAQRDGVHVFYRITEPKVNHILRCIRTCDM